MNDFSVLEWLEKAGYAAGRGTKSAYTRISKNIGIEKADYVDKTTIIRILNECPKKDIIKKLISSLNDDQNDLLIINEEPINLIDPNPNNIRSLERVYYMEDKGFVDTLVSEGLAEVLMLEGMFNGKTLTLPLARLTHREAEEKIWEIERINPIREDVKKPKKKKTKK